MSKAAKTTVKLRKARNNALIIDKRRKRRRNTQVEIRGILPLEFFFKGLRPEKRKRVDIRLDSRKTEVAPIGVAWREDGNGRGASYDHVSLQQVTKNPTRIINTTEDVAPSNLGHSLRQLPYGLMFGGVSDRFDNKKIPQICHDFEKETGLIILPGVSSTEFTKADYIQRKEQEIAIIKHARTCGQPLLAICGGAWVLGQAFGASLRTVSDHAYRGGMPRLSRTISEVTHNKQIHRIKISEDAHTLKAALFEGTTPVVLPSVNSVHSYAVSEQDFPYDNLNISAWSVSDEFLAPINPHSHEKAKLNPESCIEAFETRNGTPMIGVQWHPEAYTNHVDSKSNIHANLINWMTKAGHTYKARQRVNEEIKLLGSDVKQALKKTNQLILGKIILRKNTFLFFKLSSDEQLRHKREYDNEINMKYFYLNNKIKSKY